MPLVELTPLLRASCRPRLKTSATATKCDRWRDTHRSAMERISNADLLSPYLAPYAQPQRLDLAAA
jgi:hypothetical protein